MNWAGLIPTAARIVYHLVKYFTSKHYRSKKKAENRRTQREKLHQAVEKGDTREVNRRVRKVLKLIPVALLFVAAGCAGTGGGEVMYIAEEEKVVRMEHNGKPGWWVPNAVMFKLIDEAEKEGDE